MKVVKLDKRHKLYHNGFTHAFRFDRWNDEARVVENKITEKFKGQYSGKWQTYWGKAKIINQVRFRPYWIGVRNDAIITQVLLSI